MVSVITHARVYQGVLLTSRVSPKHEQSESRMLDTERVCEPASTTSQYTPLIMQGIPADRFTCVPRLVSKCRKVYVSRASPVCHP